MIDICIPVYNNMRCLRVMARGVQKFGGNCRVLLHVQEPHEEEDAIDAFRHLNIEVRIASRGNPRATMANYMDELFRNGSGEWCVFLEQDTFLFRPLGEVIANMTNNGYVATGPVDTFMYDHPNSKHTSKYGNYARLSPMPGYFHSSLIILRSSEFTRDPFTVPEGFKFHGWGCLGAESYYGLRLKITDNNRLQFLRQQHSEFGFAADIVDPFQRLIATHLYYSGTKDGYAKDGFLIRDEFEWLCDEENRFLRHYVNFLENLNES